MKKKESNKALIIAVVGGIVIAGISFIFTKTGLLSNPFNQDSNSGMEDVAAQLNTQEDLFIPLQVENGGVENSEETDVEENDPYLVPDTTLNKLIPIEEQTFSSEGSSAFDSSYTIASNKANISDFESDEEDIDTSSIKGEALKKLVNRLAKDNGYKEFEVLDDGEVEESVIIGFEDSYILDIVFDGKDEYIAECQNDRVYWNLYDLDLDLD